MGHGAAVCCLTARAVNPLAVQGFRSAKREESARGLAAGLAVPPASPSCRFYWEIATARPGPGGLDGVPGAPRTWPDWV